MSSNQINILKINYTLLMISSTSISVIDILKNTLLFNVYYKENLHMSNEK